MELWIRSYTTIKFNISGKTIELTPNWKLFRNVSNSLLTVLENSDEIEFSRHKPKNLESVNNDTKLEDFHIEFPKYIYENDLLKLKINQIPQQASIQNKRKFVNIKDTSLVSTKFEDNELIISALKFGNTIIKVTIDNIEHSYKLYIKPLPRFLCDIYETNIDVPVKCIISGIDNWTLDYDLSSQDLIETRNGLTAKKPGIYKVVTKIDNKIIQCELEVIDNEA